MHSLDYVGNSYISFLRKSCKPYHVLPTSVGFNLSMVDLDPDANRYLFCVRMLGTVPAFFGEEVVPGNFSGMEDFIPSKNHHPSTSDVAVGKNFVWNNWDDTLIDSTVFFVGTYARETGIVVDKTVRPAVVSAKAISSVHKTTHGDVRLARSGKTVYAYDAYLTSLYTVHVARGRVITMFDVYRAKGERLSRTFSRHFVCEQSKKKASMHSEPLVSSNAVKTNHDKNWSLAWVSGSNRFRFIKWWVDDEVLGVDAVFGEQVSCDQKCLVKMGADRLRGLGSDAMPMMSLGSPMAELPALPGERFRGIACGHAKISRTAAYRSSAPLRAFREDVHKLVSGDRGSYVEHNSYMYMPFIILYVECVNGRKRMHISDVFFPYRRAGSARKYNFSLMYPMSVVVQGADLLMSGGIGDYYTFIATMSAQSAVDACRHDLRRFDAAALRYHVLEHHTRAPELPRAHP